MTASAFQIPLSIAPAGDAGAQGEVRAHAWFIPGDDPAMWVNELCGWGVAMEELGLLVIPTASRDPRPAGVLVIPRGLMRSEPSTSPMALPYVAIGERLFVPAGAALRPSISEEELKSWLVWDVQMLHPTVGLVGCRREEMLGVADLLTMRSASAVDWSAAQAGVVVEARVLSVKPKVPPQIGDFLRESSDDIGLDSPDSLPPLPEESALHKAAAKGALGGLAAMQWILKHLPGGGGKAGKKSGSPQSAGSQGSGDGSGDAGDEGMLARLRRWATVKQQQWRAGLEEARQRELARLMRALEERPDEGLRFALRLGGGGSHRGLAPAGDRLRPRRTDFNLSSIYSSAPADPWNVPNEMRKRLETKYRELATRELGLGRYRRAAYIFAELLGDLHSAANALKTGRFFREAATLYRDRLNRPLDAAACLENGGLLEEAADAYLALNLHQKAGDLFARLGQEDRARDAYRRAVGEFLARRDILSAANVLENKLHERDEALDLLYCEWPAGAQAGACLREWFTRMGRYLLHEEAARRLKALTRDAIEPSYANELAHVLADVATSYVGAEVRELARDRVRVVVGRRLVEPSTPSTHDSGQLLKAVTRSTLDDQLLTRDATRYANMLAARQQQQQRPARAQAKPPKALARSTSGRKISLLHSFTLGSDASWRTAIARGGTLVAQGIVEDQIAIARASWDGFCQRVTLRGVINPEVPYRLELGPVQQLAGRVTARELMTIPIRENSRVAQFTHAVIQQAGTFHDRVTVTRPACLPGGTVFDACVDATDRLWVVHCPYADEDSHLVLSAFTRSQAIDRSQSLPLEIPDEKLAETVTLAVLGGFACVTMGTQIHLFPIDIDGRGTTLALSRPVAAIAMSPAHTRPRLAIAFDEGACVCWPADKRTSAFASEMLDPVVGLTRDGLLIAASRQRTAVYQLNAFEPELLASTGPRAALPVAITSAPGDGHFAIVYADGLVQIMKCA